jgi:MoxR-like ATPase
MVKLKVGYPSPIDEGKILTRRIERAQDEVEIRQIADESSLVSMRQVIETVHIEEELKRYIIALVNNTRNDKRIAVGASPRGSLALLKLARANAALEGRAYVIPDDIKQYYQPALVHRVILVPEFWMKQRAVEDILDSLQQNIPVPVIG